jgi:DNA repair protein RadC
MNVSAAAVGPRERALEDGIAALGDADLLAILLGTGFPGRPVTLVASTLLESVGGVAGIARLGAHALAAQPGVGVAKALRLKAALELGLRAHDRAMRPRELLKSSAQVAAFAGARIGALEHEEMWVFALDGRNGLRASRRVAQGGLHGCSVTARDVLRAALCEAASSFVLVHNHPSGDPTPSVEDVSMTRIIEGAASTVGTPLVDHVIVASDGRYASMLDLGILEGA